MPLVPELPSRDRNGDYGYGSDSESASSSSSSGNACWMCRRRYISCDEALPKCRNCIEFSCDCEYDTRERGDGVTGALAALGDGGGSAAAAGGDSAVYTSVGLLSPRQRKQQVAKAAGRARPRPGLSSYALPVTQHRLLHHMSSMSELIESAHTFNLVIYMKRLPTFLTIAFSYDFVMHSLMAWAASHMTYVSNSYETQTLSRQYRMLSMQGLQRAIAVFNERNADAVLAASLLLSWQAADPFEWATLNKGTTAVVAAMEPWRETSILSGFIEEAAQYKVSPNVVKQPVNFLSHNDEAAALRYIYDALRGIERYAQGRAGETELVHKLMAFVQNVERHLPIRDPAMRFYLLEPTRSMLFWYPAKFCREARTDPVVMVVLAHLYAISLTVQPVFAGHGAAHFRGLSVSPIEDIYATLVERHRATGKAMATFVPLSLMHFPMQSVGLFRSRMGLDRPDGSRPGGDCGDACADQSLTAIRYGLDPLAEAGAAEIMSGGEGLGGWD